MSLTHRLTANTVVGATSVNGRSAERTSNSNITTKTTTTSTRSDVVILACSSSKLMTQQHYDLLYSRPLCADRKGVFEHLAPKRFFKSSLRVVIMQGTQVATLYLNDQLKEDMARDELVAKGKLSRREADEEADEWAEREWNKRWSAFPHRLWVAFAKYHSIILVMRLYEYVAEKVVDVVTLDRLTIDTFDAAKRSAQTKEGTELAKDVFGTCIKANFISYLSDYTVHQFILIFSYYVYVKEQKRQMKKLQEIDEGGEDGVHGGSLALSLMKNSVLLAISRGIGLVFSSIGGGLGAMITPGWGSLAGANLGDGLAMAVSEEIVGPKAPFT